ncbi:MAG: helix-turn-helix transcriptional regulator [Chloroflexi bacterium]|nr:helix-turn-helix transcriptional regulator [Chloroflexota bacterium]
MPRDNAAIAMEQDFGAILRKLRLERNLSQEELAAQSGFHRTYISLLERGLKSPSLTTITRLANALDVAPHRIILLAERLQENDSRVRG